MQDALVANNAFEITPVGLLITGSPTFSDVEDALHVAWQLGQFSKWAQIDLLVWARDQFGEAFAQLVDTYHYSPGTVSNMLWIGTNIPIDARVEGVSLSHHQVVAPPRFSIDEKRRLLELAKDMRWSRDELRSAVAELPDGESPYPDMALPINNESAIRMVIDWLDGKVSYSQGELKEILLNVLREHHESKSNDN